jgi:hypothetical protein
VDIYLESVSDFPHKSAISVFGQTIKTSDIGIDFVSLGIAGIIYVLD